MAKKTEPAYVPGERTLHPDDTGPDVKAAQAALGVKQTGTFDLDTTEAVKRLQRLRGIPQQGVLGPATWAWLLESAPAVQLVVSPTEQLGADEAQQAVPG
jgi:murein L,D-transpeptidase YcbB/YkuD